MPKVALCLIVKGVNEEAPLLKQCLESVSTHVDGIFITLTHNKSEQITNKVRRVAEKYTKPQNIKVYEWDGNFVKARTANFAQVPKDYDFIIWLDSDDTVDHPEKIKEVASIVPKNVSGVFICYDYAHDEYGNVTVPHYVARLVRNNGVYKWQSSFDDAKYAVHETLVEQRVSGKRVNEEFKVIHHADPQRSFQSLFRNIDLLRKMYERQNKKGRIDPRILFYLGTHLFDAQEYKEAKGLLQDYMTLSGWNNERSEALVYLGLIYALEGKDGQAKHAYVLAISEAPNNPRPYTEIAQLEFDNRRFESSAEWALKAIECKKRQTAMALRPMDATFRPYMIYSRALTELGGIRLETAAKYVDKALKLRPLDPEARQQQDLIGELIEVRDLNRAFAKLVRAIGKDENKLRTLLQSVPEKLADSPVVAQVRHDYTIPRVWQRKSMAIFCGASIIETWGPFSLAKGVGGSEEAVIQLKKELEKLGWEVHVYGTPGLDVNDTWHNYWEFNPSDEFDVVIAWRNPGFFDLEIKARKKYLWLHDMMEKSEFTPERLDNLDKVIVLSKYHRRVFSYIPDNKIFLSANGIEPEVFRCRESAGIPRDPHRIIWMSSHVRGLEMLYYIWPDVKKAVPEAILDIYYGWESFVSVLKDNPERMTWKTKMEDWVKELDGVTDHGKISHDQIVKEIFRSAIWAYPCVTGDTLVDTPRNYQKYPLGIPIKKLVGKKNFPVWSYNVTTGRFELKNVNWVVKTRINAKIIKINWQDGTTLRCTPDHQVYTYKRGWVKAKDLEPNESVVALKKHMMIQVSAGEGKWPYEHRMIAEYMGYKIPKGHHVHHKDDNCFNNSPENLEVLSPSEHAKHTYKEQYSTPALIERRKMNLAKYRATPKGKKQLASIGSKRGHKFWDGMDSDERQAFIDRRNLVRYNHKVESIEDGGLEDVYDMNVQDNHNFIAGGVVVHNCPFPEIYCITAVKAQAGGAVPVSSNFAALDETVQFGIKVPMKAQAEDKEVGKWDKTEIERYKQALIEMLQKPALQEKIRPEMMLWARTQSWERVALQWTEEMK